MAEGDREFVEQFAQPPVTVNEATALYVTAYLLLDTEREYLANIPWSAYVRYGEYYQLTRDQVDWLIEIGFRVDKVILADRAKKQDGNP